MTAPAPCPSEEALAAYSAARVSTDLAEIIEAHLDECASCRRSVAAAVSEDATPVIPGANVGRYRVLGRAGRGGMGVVYAAWDPDLARKVALKLVRPELLGDGSEGRARLQREAQSLARLSHPNVVAAFDVGAHGSELFLAMEFVDGETLGEWLARTPRSWHAVLDVFRQAGAGLAAAHDAGLLHRDFKPANVLVGADGRVRVTDFGLARLAGAGELLLPVASATSETAGAASVTRTGTVLGTPGYMAPEQARGVVDARSDQFSFCVSLREALAASTPAAVQRVVRRGLEPDPAARFPDMHALLGALDAAVTRRRRLRAGAVAGAAAAAGLGLLWALTPSPCAGATERIASVWNPETAAAIDAAFRGTQAPFAADVSAHVRRSLDGWTAEWAVSRQEACYATRVRGDQSGTALDLRVACLERGRSRLSALTDLWKAADKTLVEKAVDAAGALPAPSSCDDVVALAQRAPLPSDPDARERLTALAETAARLSAAREAGRPMADAGAIDDAIAAADALGYAPMRAELFQIRGRQETDRAKYADAEKSLQAALNAAIEGGDDRRAAELWADLVWVVGYQQSRYDEGDRSVEHARALLRRIGGDDRVDAMLSSHEGVIAWRRGRFAEADAAHRRGLEIRRRILAPDDPLIAQSLTNLGIVANALSRRDDAAQFHRDAIALLERSVGPAHPEVARALSNLGSVYYAEQRYEDALEVQLRSLELLRAARGEEHPLVAAAHNNVGSNYLGLGRFAEARTHFERSLEIKRKVYGEGSTALASSHANLADLARQEGRARDALDGYRRALEIWEAKLGEKHPLVAVALTGMGESLMLDGHARDALAPLERALAIREAGNDALERGETRFALARALATVGADRPRARRLADLAKADFAATSAGADEAASVDGWLKTHASPGR